MRPCPSRRQVARRCLPVAQGFRQQVEATVGLLEHADARGRVFHVGTDEETTIRALAEGVRDLVDPGVSIVHVPYEEAYEEGFEDLGRRVPDLSRVRDLLGYRPTLTLDEILGRIIEHVRTT